MCRGVIKSYTLNSSYTCVQFVCVVCVCVCVVVGGGGGGVSVCV